MKKTITFVLLLFSAFSYSQNIRNGSFEEVDSLGNLVGWKIKSGNIVRVNSSVFYGIPFTASDQLYFLSMQNDTSSSAIRIGNIANTFSLSMAPPTMSFSYFYAPTYFTQRSRVDVLFTKWKINKRDTILYSNYSLAPNVDTANNLIVKWVNLKLDLQSAYRDTVIPDSAMITILNDVIPPYSNSTLLYLDNFNFSSLKVGLDEVADTRNFSIFPNPANDVLHVNYESCKPSSVKFVFYDISGKIIKEVSAQDCYSNKSEYLISTNDLPSGLYFIEIKEIHNTFHKKCFIVH